MISELEKPIVAATNDIVHHRGRAVSVAGIQIGGKRLIIEGRLPRIARLKDEWYDEIGDPEMIISALRTSSPRPDLFTFRQRLPDTAPLYPYYYEQEALSAIPLKDYQHWLNHQIKTDTRKKIKRPQKRGVEIKVVPLDDEFVNGVMEVFNDTPIRRGRRFSHYGEQFHTLKAKLSRDLVSSDFIGAYEAGKLVGFVKLVYAPDRFANPGLIVSKLEARKKYVNNALLAKAVELCTDRHIPYLTYTNWRRGTQREFLVRHGFEKILTPRYWIPLTTNGAVILKLGLHRNIRTYIPDPAYGYLLTFKGALYRHWLRIHPLKTAENS